MSHQERICQAGNTVVPALLALRALGYRVQRDVAEEPETWRAQTEDLELMAESPMALLGLAQMRSLRGADWRASDSEIESVLREYFD